MEINIRNIEPSQKEYIEIGCHAEDARVKSIVRFVKGLDGSVSGSKGEHIYEVTSSAGSGRQYFTLQNSDNLMKRLPTTDNFRSYPLGMQWEWNHLPDQTAWSLFERQGWLRIKTNQVVSSLPQARNMLTQRIFMNPDKATTGTVRLDVSRLQEGDRAGICIFQDPYAAIAIEKKNGEEFFVVNLSHSQHGGENFSS